MKILLKRNGASGSNLPATVSAGEPVWFKDILYVGSVGTSLGGVEQTAGTPVRVAMYRDLASIDHNQTIKGNGTAFGADAAVNIAPGSNISVTADTASNTITIANTYSYTHPSAGTNTGSFGPSADASPAHGGTFSVPYFTVNSAGHVTAASTKTITLPTDANDNQKVKSGSSTFGDNAVVNITASTGLTTSVTTTSGSEKIEIKHDTPSGAATTTSGFYKIATDSYGHVTGTTAVTASDITGLVTIPAAANNAKLYFKKDTGTSVQVFSANESTDKTANFIAGTNISLTENTATSNTYKLTVAHSTPSNAATKSAGFYKFGTDSQGHAVNVSAVAWSDITGLSGYTDNNDTYTFSTTATTGNFTNTASGSSHTITLTEIDGGTF